MTGKRKPEAGFGAATDDPKAIIRRAKEQVREACPDEESCADRSKLRDAAELGWLAASSTADIVASMMGSKPPRDQAGARRALSDLESTAGLPAGKLTGRFATARQVLHSDCFYQDSCDLDAVHHVLDDVDKLIDDSYDALRAIRDREPGFEGARRRR